MAEIIGVVAAATQLGSTCLTMMSLMKRIKGSKSSLEDYIKQLQELCALSETIAQNSLLHTPQVEAQTLSILSLIKANDLTPLITKGRYTRTCLFLYKDRQISESLIALERRKSTLSLIIHNLQSEAIYRIQSDIKIMAGSRPKRHDSLDHEGDSTYGSQIDESDYSDTIQSEPPKSRLDHRPSATRESSGGAPYLHEYKRRTRVSDYFNKETEDFIDNLRRKGVTGSIFMENLALGNSSQSNGSVTRIMTNSKDIDEGLMAKVNSMLPFGDGPFTNAFFGNSTAGGAMSNEDIYEVPSFQALNMINTNGSFFRDNAIVPENDSGSNEAPACQSNKVRIFVGGEEPQESTTATTIVRGQGVEEPVSQFNMIRGQRN